MAARAIDGAHRGDAVAPVRRAARTGAAVRITSARIISEEVDHVRRVALRLGEQARDGGFRGHELGAVAFGLHVVADLAFRLGEDSGDHQQLERAERQSWRGAEGYARNKSVFGAGEIDWHARAVA